jgi:hypothetical protein
MRAASSCLTALLDEARFTHRDLETELMIRMEPIAILVMSEPAASAPAAFRAKSRTAPQNRLLLTTAIVLVMSSSVFAEWQPPENPDSSTILNEAQADARAGRFEVALAKHVWYHENALKYDQGQGGVRRSFALGYWHELAEKFPPAGKKLEDFREEARKRVLAEKKKVFHDFADFAAISRELEKEGEIVELFVALDKKDPKLASQAYNSAEEALIDAKKFKLCGKYIKGDEAIEREIEMFEHHREIAKDPRFGARMARYGEESFHKDAATIVAILAKCGREEESKRAAAKAHEAWNDEQFHKALDSAIEGELPKDR